MNLTLKEMNGLLNGECLPSDLIVGETLAEYLVRKFAEADAKFAALAAENAELKAVDVWMNADEVGGSAADKAIENGATPEEATRAGVQAVIESIKTPATDAFLAEVRAQGVEMFASSLGSPYLERGEECYQDGYTHAIERIKCRKAPEFADELRKGVQS